MRLLKGIFNNLGLKILAAVLAILVWLAITNTQDPNITKTYTIPVMITNADSLEDTKSIQILNNTDTVSFSVTASRSVIQGLSESDFTATANIENIDESMTMIPITISASRYENQITISKKEDYLEVSIENLITSEFEIEYDLQEGEPAANCEVSRVSISPSKVEVSGPQSVMEQIGKAVVYPDVNAASEDLALNCDIVLLDADGQEIAQDYLELNRTIAAVDVTIMMEKEVPINVQTTGTLPDGYVLGDVTPSKTRVALRGSPEKLSEIEEITMSSTKLSLTNRTQDFTVNIGLAEQIPSGVSLVNEEDSTISVTVQVLSEAQAALNEIVTEN